MNQSQASAPFHPARASNGPATPVSAAYATTKLHLASLANVMVSTENVERVVNEPRTPTPNSKACCSLMALAATSAVTAPKNNEPTKLTVSVAQGKPSEGRFTPTA